MRCHLPYMFSRWIEGKRYRNSIKIDDSPPPARPCAPLGIDPIPIKFRRFSYEIPTSRALAPSRFFMAVFPSGTNASCQAIFVGIATLSSFPAKKLNFPKNAAPAEYLPFRVPGPPQQKNPGGRRDTGVRSA